MFETMAEGVECSFRGGNSVERGCLFEEILCRTFFVVASSILCFTLRLKWLFRGIVLYVVMHEQL